MANEFKINVDIDYEDSEDSVESLGVTDVRKSISSKKYVRGKINVGTTEEAIPLGELTSLGRAVFVNRDATNYVEIRSATGAANDVIRVDPLDCAYFRFGSDVTAPYIIANTGACQVEYIIFAP